MTGMTAIAGRSRRSQRPLRLGLGTWRGGSVLGRPALGGSVRGKSALGKSALRGALLARDGLAVAVEELDAVVVADAVRPTPGQETSAAERRTADAGVNADAPALAPANTSASADASVAHADLASALADPDDPFTRAAVTAGRVLLAALEASCSAPVGVPADPAADAGGEPVTELRPRGVVGTTDGTSLVQMSITGPTPNSRDDAVTPLKMGRVLAAEMLAQGAAGPMGERAL